MKMFILEEVTQSEQRFEYQLENDTSLTLVLVLVKPMYADVRVSVRVRLSSKGASATIIGLFRCGGSYRVSIHTEQIHEAPETTSNLLVKAALSDEASFTYDGIIRVERKAQKSDAYQKNENLLLSPHAKARSDPALEILANDVRCTHGSTTGKLNEDQLWYLTSRGLSIPVAKRLLVEGFFEHATAAISDTIHQESIKKILWQTIPKQLQ